MKIFFSSPGRRVELIKLFKKEIKDIGYEEILIRMAWSLTKIMNDNKIK